MGTDNFKTFITWIDVAHVLNINIQGHTKILMSFEWVIFHRKASKKQLNTKSTAESVVIGVSEYLPHMIWMINSLKKSSTILRRGYYIRIIKLPSKWRITDSTILQETRETSILGIFCQG